MAACIAWKHQERRSSHARNRLRGDRPRRECSRAAAQRAGPPDDLPRHAGVHELALRTAVVAQLGRPARSVAPHDRSVHLRAGRAQAPERHGGEQLRELRRRQGEAVHRGEPRGVPHRRRHPVPSRRGRVRSRRLVHGARLGAVHRRDRRLRRHVRARRQLPDARTGREPEALPLRAAGSAGAGAHGEAHRRTRAADEVLQHGDLHDRRAPGALAPPRHGGTAGVRALRSLGGGRPRPRCDRRRRGGIRPDPRRGQGLLVGQPRIGVGAVAASRDLHRRRQRGVPPLAPGEPRGLARRKLRVGEHRGRTT